jgi:pyrroline-5-carboxylate reductase
MGAALMKSAAKVIGGANIGFTDVEAAKAKMLAGSLGARIYSSNTEAAENANFVFLAVKPQALKAVLEELAPVLKKRSEQGNTVILVSMAAGWSIEAIKKVILFHLDEAIIPIIRIMPNTPALIGKGVIALAASSEVDEDKVTEIEKILSGAGIVDRIDERYLDAVTALSGSSPAFVYMFVEALSDAGVLVGLSRDKAAKYAVQTVLGAAAMVKETGKHPGELKDMVTSPAGTTIAGVGILENAAFRGAIISAVDAAFKRALALGEK